MSDPAPSPNNLGDRPYISESYRGGTARPLGIDERQRRVAIETNHDLDTVRIHGIKWCEANPKGGDLDQTLPADFDEQIMAAGEDEAAIRSARRQAIETHGVDIYLDGCDAIVLKGVTLENALVSGEDIEPIIAELVETGESTAAHPDGGLVYVVRPTSTAASLWPKRSEDLGDGNKAAATLDALRQSKDLMDRERNRPFGRKPTVDGRLPAGTHRLDVRGGVAIVCLVGHREIWRTPALTVDEADALEPAYLAALETFRDRAPRPL